MSAHNASGILFVAATPIGNLQDVTLRALDVLRRAQYIYAEDTRRTRALLTHHGIKARARLRSLHAHNEAARCAGLLRALAEGATVALLCDAGTPLLSDPGARACAAALNAGYQVAPLPGASAVLAALAASGLPAVPFTFAGFLPRKGRARQAALAQWAARPETLVFFEAPRRAAETLQEMAHVFGPRRACCAREITKMHEQFIRGTLTELAALVAAHSAQAPLGEITLVVEGAAAHSGDADETKLRAEVSAALAAGESARSIAVRLRRELGAARNRVYALALELQRAK